MIKYFNVPYQTYTYNQYMLWVKVFKHYNLIVIILKLAICLVLLMVIKTQIITPNLIKNISMMLDTLKIRLLF